MNILGKLTVIQTLCIPKVTHIASVIPNLNTTRINEIEACLESFINEGRKCPVDQKTRYVSKKENGLGMLKIVDFWMALRLSWLKRLPYTKSFWGKLHREEVGKLGFCPVNSHKEDLEKAKMSIKNPVWKDIYCALLKCRTNYVTLHPEEFLTIPVTKEPVLTANFTGLQQGW